MTATTADRTEVTISRETAQMLAARELRRRVDPRMAAARGFDRHDAHAAHALARDGRAGEALACARLLDAGDAMAAGGFSAQRLFVVTRPLTLPGRLAEVDEVCVISGPRAAAALNALWRALAREASSRGAAHLIVCEAVAFDPEVEALSPLKLALAARRAPDAWRMFPRRPAPRDPAGAARAVPATPALEAALAAGALLAGEPSWDEDAGTAVFPFLIEIKGPTSCAF